MAIEPHDGNSRPDVLDPSLPPFDNDVNEGDNHLRLLKIVCKNFMADWAAERQSVQNRIAALEAVLAGGQVNDAAMLGGELPSHFTDAGEKATGILPTGRLVGNYAMDVLGSAATASLADMAPVTSLAADTGKLGGKTLAELLVGRRKLRLLAQTSAPFAFSFSQNVKKQIASFSFDASPSPRLAFVHSKLNWEVTCLTLESFGVPFFYDEYNYAMNGQVASPNDRWPQDWRPFILPASISSCQLFVKEWASGSRISPYFQIWVL